ncbi:di/tricarboxylate transporter [Kibdelosporangium banguiense]|uniref:Di/tricarboxylate transporter n=1 Tax=Kibdelosporangium banguiense TaxID=1365924 RepID=A0ABS4TZR8_9PSEU|nr:hypothetical protein [Kibdelosporangium banguiense]MBP2329411.1 di/tricarboxylate transporter [Kibdelosporangium banguiense]
MVAIASFGQESADLTEAGLAGLLKGVLTVRPRQPLAVLIAVNAIVLGWFAVGAPGAIALLPVLITLWTRQGPGRSCGLCGGSPR